MATDTKQQTAFDLFLSKLPPEEAKRIRSAIAIQNSDYFLTETVSSAIRQHPEIELPNYSQDHILQAAQDEWNNANPLAPEERPHLQAPQKGVTLRDFFPHQKEGGGGNDQIPPTSSFEGDLKKVQKELVLQKLKKEIERYKGGEVRSKDFLPVLRDIVGKLSLDQLFVDQHLLISSLVNNADVLNNRQADKQNLLVNLERTHTHAQEQLATAQKEGKMQVHPDLFDKQRLVEQLFDGIRGYGGQTTDDILQRVSKIIDHQQEQIKPFTRQKIQQAQEYLPLEAFNYLAQLFSQQAVEWTEMIEPTVSGYRTRVQHIQQVATIAHVTPGKEGDIVPVAPTFLNTDNYGKRSRTRQAAKTAGKRVVKTAENVGKKVIKKVGKEAAKSILKQIGSFIISNPWVLAIFAAIIATFFLIILLSFIISSALTLLGQLSGGGGGSTPPSGSQDVRAIVAVASTIQACEKAPFGFWIPPTPTCALSILGLSVVPRGDLLSFGLNVASRFPNYQCGQYIWAAQKYILHWPVFPGNVGSVFQWYLIHPDHSLPGYVWIANPAIINHQRVQANIAAGDIILYGSTGRSDPGHIAIVVGFPKDKNGVEDHFFPIVTEANYHHGAIDIRPTNLFDNLGRGANILGWWRRK